MSLLERDGELGILSRALARAATGSGAGLAVTGEPGAGKCAIYEYYNADRQRAESHADHAAVLAPGKASVEYGSVRTTRAYLAYHKSQYDLARRCTVDATRIARQCGDAALRVRTALVDTLTDLAVGVDGARDRAVDLI